jgi:ABC-type branched-subunit amino acid transport system substrate-binding protein
MVGTPPSHNEAKAYDSVYLVKKVVEQCGPSGDRIASCLREVSYTGESGLIEFDKNGQIKSSEGTKGAVMTVKSRNFERLR